MEGIRTHRKKPLLLQKVQRMPKSKERTASETPSVVVAILAGGQGERLKPLSTSQRPKQFLDLLMEGQTLIESTIARARRLSSQVYTVVPRTLSTLAHQYAGSATQVLTEPFPWNTCAATIFCSWYLMHTHPAGENCVVVFLPADHWIEPIDEWVETLRAAIAIARESSYIVTVGVVPTYPHTGYGYIQMGNFFPTAEPVHAYYVQRFVEKPPRHLAETFVRSGEFLWNCGIFVWRVGVFLKVLQMFFPEVYSAFATIEDWTNLADLERAYQVTPRLSIDHALLERIPEHLAVVRADFQWSDLGDWFSILQILQQRQSERIISLPIAHEECQLSVIQYSELLPFAHATSPEDKHFLLVITDQGILLVSASQSQRVRQLQFQPAKSSN